nr:MAG TPA: hypothetical protein [Caudoviricetes sp.]
MLCSQWLKTTFCTLGVIFYSIKQNYVLIW